MNIRSCREKILSNLVKSESETTFKDIKRSAAPYSKSVILGELVKLNELGIIEYNALKIFQVSFAPSKIFVVKKLRIFVVKKT